MKGVDKIAFAGGVRSENNGQWAQFKVEASKGFIIIYLNPFDHIVILPELPFDFKSAARPGFTIIIASGGQGTF